MQQQRVSRTDVRRARRSRDRRRARATGAGAAAARRTGGGSEPDLDQDLLQRITRVINEVTSTQRHAPAAP